MNTELLVIGKVKQSFIKDGIEEYSKRINRFIKFQVKRIPSVKTKFENSHQIVNAESEKLLSNIANTDNLILLDVKGKQMETPKLSRFIEKSINQYPGKSIFVIGGAYGVNELLRERANHILSLSSLTFTHDMSQLILLEQIYRSYMILKNIPYHH